MHPGFASELGGRQVDRHETFSSSSIEVSWRLPAGPDGASQVPQFPA
jgi:hypothetical protein